MVGGGFKFGMGPISGGIEVTDTLGRTDLDPYTVMGTVRYAF